MKKVSYKNFKGIVDAVENSAVVDVCGVSVEVKKFLTIDEMFEFVNIVAQACFWPDSGKYRPEIKDYIVRKTIIDMYTNIAMPEKIDEQYNFLYRTNVVMAVMAYIDQTQFSVIMAATDCKIEDAIAINESRFENEVNDVINKITEFANSANNVFEDVSNEDVKRLINVVSNMDVDPEKLVQAVIESNRE